MLNSTLKRIAQVFLCAAVASPTFAEHATYNAVRLDGLARDTGWISGDDGTRLVMVCNVNGPDGFLSVRSGPGTNYKVRRSLKRLAVVTVDAHQREGNWVKVRTAYRSHSIDGTPLSQGRSLHVEGWAHDGYLCNFLDF